MANPSKAVGYGYSEEDLREQWKDIGGFSPGLDALHRAEFQAGKNCVPTKRLEDIAENRTELEKKDQDHLNVCANCQQRLTLLRDMFAKHVAALHKVQGRTS